MPYTPPQKDSEGFNCPFCKAYSHQIWSSGYVTGNGWTQVQDVKFALCVKCKKYSIWHSYKMIHPLLGEAPLPHQDLPYDIRRDYDEASTVLSLSPRSSAALLRLAIEKLTIHILKDEVGRDLNDNIKKLVDNGLPVLIQQSLDILRVIGNNALHPGQLDLKDDQQTALQLFNFVNLITDYMITKPQQTDALYQSLPEDSRKAIDKRDNKKPSSD